MLGPMKDQTPSGIQVIDRAARLLAAIAAAGGPVSLKYLSADTGLHPSTTFRILAALQQHELVEKGPDGSYTLGRGLARLAQRLPARPDLRELAKPIMNELRDRTGETVNLTVREGDEVVYVERVLPNRMMRVEQVIGSRAPLHVTAVGKLLLGEDSEEACRDYARRTGLPKYTANTLVSQKSLLADIKQCVARGYARDNEEAELGVGCVGVLVRDTRGEAVAGLSISAPRERLKEDWIPLLQTAGRRLSRHLGYSD